MRKTQHFRGEDVNKTAPRAPQGTTGLLPLVSRQPPLDMAHTTTRPTASHHRAGVPFGACTTQSLPLPSTSCIPHIINYPHDAPPSQRRPPHPLELAVDHAQDNRRACNIEVAAATALWRHPSPVDAFVQAQRPLGSCF